MFSDFHFIRPYWLLFLIPCFIVWLGFRYNLNNQQQTPSYIENRFYQYLKVNITQNKSLQILLYSLLAFWCLLVIAMSGPSWLKKQQPVYQDNFSRVLILDLSRQSLVEDIKPNRLARVKYKVTDILKSISGQFAIIAYADDAYLVSPMTQDNKSLLHLVNSLHPSIMPGDGRNLSEALKLAQDTLKNSQANNGEIIVFTNDADSIAIQTANNINKQYPIKIFGVGTKIGAPIPTDTGFIKNDSGKIIFSRLSSENLIKLSKNYHEIQINDQDINTLLKSSGQKIFKKNNQQQTHTVALDQGYWLAIACLPLALLFFRKGILFGLIFFILPVEQDYAFNLKNLFQTNDQQAYEQYNKGNPERAAELFENQQWQAASHFKAKQYNLALESIKNQTDADSLYNKGNILAHLGKYKEAINAYEQALTEKSDLADAKHNLDVIKKFLKQQENSGKTGKNGDSKQADEGKQKNNSKNSGQKSKGQDQANNTKQGKKDTKNNKAENSKDQAQNSPKSKDNGKSKQNKQQAHNSNDKKPQKYSSNSNTDIKQKHAGKNEKQGQQVYENPELDQWLAQIPNDTKELLRRKFLLDKMRRQ